MGADNLTRVAPYYIENCAEAYERLFFASVESSKEKARRVDAA